MNTQRIIEDTAKNISHAMQLAEVNTHQLSRVTGIPYPTLRRKLMGRGEFLQTDLFHIATALKVAPYELLAEPFQSKRVA